MHLGFAVLGRGLIAANFQISGKVSLSRHKLKSLQKTGANSTEHSFRILVHKLSGPYALPTLHLEKSFDTSSTVIGVN